MPTPNEPSQAEIGAQSVRVPFNLSLSTPSGEASYMDEMSDLSLQSNGSVMDAVVYDESPADYFIAAADGGSAQISLTNPTDISVTRTTDTSMVNNILSPGNNLEYDSGCRLLWANNTPGFVYVGNSTTSGLYLTPENGDGTNGGEQVLLEAGGYPLMQDLAIYQNTLSGDGAESFQCNSCGTQAAGLNVVIADNDFSNMLTGVDYSSGGGINTESFDIVSGNSIHNCRVGITIGPTLSTLQQNTPWFICNSYNGNIISGGQPGSTGIQITTYAAESNNPPQILMNVFSGDVVTGVSIGVDLDLPFGLVPNQLGTLVLSTGFFSSDGSWSSSLEINQADEAENPALFYDEPWQGFWTVPVV